MFITEQTRGIMPRPKKYEKTIREMAEQAGVSVGTIAKTLKLYESGANEADIEAIKKGDKSIDQVLREMGINPDKDTARFIRAMRAVDKFSEEELLMMLGKVIELLENTNPALIHNFLGLLQQEKSNADS